MRTFRDFVNAGYLRGDRGQRVALSPLLERFVAAVESGASTIVVCTPRRCGKSTCISQLVGFYLLTRSLSFTLTLASTVDQASDILEQKLTLPLRNASGTSRLGLQFARGRIQLPKLATSATVIPCSDVSSPGRTVDLLVLDECRGIPEAAVEALRPSAAGGLIVMTGTPGAPRGWWHSAVTSPEAGAAVITMSDPAEAGNPELDLAFVARERARLAARGAYGKLLAEREWSAHWVDITDSPLIDPALVERAAVDEVPAFDGQEDAVYVGVDLSVSRDLCSAAVLAKRGDALRVLELVVMDPQAYGGTIPFELVEQRIESLWKLYHPRQITMDQYQGVAVAQRLQAKGVRIEAIPITGVVNMQAFGSLVEVLNAGRLSWPRDLPGAARLSAELLNLSVAEGASGFRVVDASKRYHRDVSFSLALAAWKASTAPVSRAGERIEPIRINMAQRRERHRRQEELANSRDPRTEVF